MTWSIPVSYTHLDVYKRQMVALYWIHAQSTRWKTYVANRVGEIQRLTQTYTWHHINSRHNPADIISRRCLPDVLHDCSLWWHGPSCLSQSSESNPFPSFVPVSYTHLSVQSLAEFTNTITSSVNSRSLRIQ